MLPQLNGGSTASVETLDRATKYWVIASNVPLPLMWPQCTGMMLEADRRGQSRPDPTAMEVDLVGENFTLGLVKRAVALLAFAFVLTLPATALVLAQGLNGTAGPYLAAESAARRGDIAEAARLYAKALARDTANADLLERTVTHQIAAGQIDRAIPLARRLDALRPGHHLGVLLEAAEALKLGKPSSARSLLETGAPDGGPSRAPLS